ncbi:hypothetical protein BPO_0720 [Bergeyella porcorum]|uniref:Uncharacterized protein n=1 Tax=Bergeyella porcorum TaxID=1735111 RepID=A0AAU0F233_9FLAO
MLLKPSKPNLKKQVFLDIPILSNIVPKFFISENIFEKRQKKYYAMNYKYFISIQISELLFTLINPNRNQR